MTTGQSPDAASKDFGVHAVSLGLYPAIGMLEGQWPVFLPNTEEVYRDSANAVEKVISIEVPLVAKSAKLFDQVPHSWTFAAKVKILVSRFE
jgi:hypothetical protein